MTLDESEVRPLMGPHPVTDEEVLAMVHAKRWDPEEVRRRDKGRLRLDLTQAESRDMERLAVDWMLRKGEITPDYAKQAWAEIDAREPDPPLDNGPILPPTG